MEAFYLGQIRSPADRWSSLISGTVEAVCICFWNCYCIRKKGWKLLVSAFRQERFETRCVASELKEWIASE